MAEVSFVIKYLDARRKNNSAVLIDLLMVLPVVMAHNPSSAFVATMSMLDNGGLRADLIACEPMYHTKPELALVGTAIDAIYAMQPQALDLAQMLQSQLGRPVTFT